MQVTHSYGRFGMAREEAVALLTSFVSFMLLLACYYILRPVRDALAATLGADSIKYLSTMVFVVMLLIVPVFGWLFARVPRPRLVPGLYAFFILNLGAFAVAFGRYGVDVATGAWWARAFTCGSRCSICLPYRYFGAAWRSCGASRKAAATSA